MKFSDEQIKDILAMKEKMTAEIEKHQEDIELLEKNIRILDSILKDTSFTKASLLVGKPKENSMQESIPLKRGSSGEIIANAYVTPEQLSIVLEENVGINENTPPFKSFFLERIIGEMKRKDSQEVENGRIQKESVIDYIVNKNGTNIREIIIKNYRDKERINEIINTAAWSLTRMLENSTK